MVLIVLLSLGGAGNWQHISELFLTTEVSAACTQNIFHFTEESINSAKNFLKQKKLISDIKMVEFCKIYYA